jgi:signal transduction histidine kinase
VLDRGPGLPEPVGELIRRRKPGLRHGHGLRIADAIATAHGGRLVAAPSSSGARLVLELPTAGPSLEVPTARPPLEVPTARPPESAHAEPR